MAVPLIQWRIRASANSFTNSTSSSFLQKKTETDLLTLVDDEVFPPSSWIKIQKSPPVLEEPSQIKKFVILKAGIR